MSRRRKATEGGNGLAAAFTAGIAFGWLAGPAGPKQVWYVEQTAGPASLLVWLLFGAVIVPVVADSIDWQVALFAVLSLTVLRALPVLLALAGTGLGHTAEPFAGR